MGKHHEGYRRAGAFSQALESFVPCSRWSSTQSQDEPTKIQKIQIGKGFAVVEGEALERGQAGSSAFR